MKTVEEIAKSVALKCAIDFEYNGVIESDIKDACVSAIQMAQKWIPVNEELPEKGIQVLVKNKYEVYEVARLLNSGWNKDFEVPYTHWKYIDLEK